MSQFMLKQSFSYDEDTGEVTLLTENDYGERLKITSKRQKITLYGTNYSLRRSVWKWMTGEDPRGKIYHKNGDWRDYRWENLTNEKPVTAKERRIKNKDRIQKDSKTGKSLPVGVNESGARYYSVFTHKGQRFYSGIKDTPEEAAEFYEFMADLHGVA